MRRSALEPALLFPFSAASQIHIITDHGARKHLSMMQPAIVASGQNKPQPRTEANQDNKNCIWRIQKWDCI